MGGCGCEWKGGCGLAGGRVERRRLRRAAWTWKPSAAAAASRCLPENGHAEEKGVRSKRVLPERPRKERAFHSCHQHWSECGCMRLRS
eukprot:3028880-Pleurochrysis_carterae.AAC.2